MEQKENIYTIPNFLSAWRIISFPLILFFIFTGRETLFSIFLVVNLVTDILDGFIARNFNQQTKLGARLDSIADTGTYILAFAGILRFKNVFFQEQLIWFISFGALFVFSWSVTMIKFGRLCGLHLWSYKLTGYLQGILFAWMFTGDVPHWYFVTSIAVGCLANIEEIFVFLILKEPKSNVKGIYWVLKSERKPA